MRDCPEFYLRENGSIPKMRRRTKRFGIDVLRNAVKHMLSSGNVLFLSRRTRTLKVDGERKMIPGISRERNPEAMYRDYIYTEGEEKILGRTSYAKIVTSIPCVSCKKKAAVDNILGTICYDSFDLLTRIAKDFCSGLELKRTVEQLQGAQDFLKFSYLCHV